MSTHSIYEVTGDPQTLFEVYDYQGEGITVSLPEDLTANLQTYQERFRKKHDAYIAPYLGNQTLFLAPQTVATLIAPIGETDKNLLDHLSTTIAQNLGIDETEWDGEIGTIEQKPLVTSAIFEDIVLADYTANIASNKDTNHFFLRELGTGTGFTTANTWIRIKNLGIDCTIHSVEGSTKSAACAAANFEIWGIPYIIVANEIPEELDNFNGVVIQIADFQQAIDNDINNGTQYDAAISAHGSEYVVVPHEDTIDKKKTAIAQGNLINSLMETIKPNGEFVTSALDTGVRYELDPDASKKAVITAMFRGSKRLHNEFSNIRKHDPNRNGQEGKYDPYTDQYVITKTHSEAAAALYSLIAHASRKDRAIIMEAIQTTTSAAKELGKSVSPLSLTLTGLAGHVIENIDPDRVQSAITDYSIIDVKGLFGFSNPSTTQVMSIKKI